MMKRKPKKNIVKNAIKKRAKAREGPIAREPRSYFFKNKRKTGAVSDKGDKFVKMTLIQGAACVLILLFGLFIKESSWKPAVNLKNAINKTLTVSTNMREIEVFFSDIGTQYEDIKEKAIEVFSGQKSIESVFSDNADKTKEPNTEKEDVSESGGGDTVVSNSAEGTSSTINPIYLSELLGISDTLEETFVTSNNVKEIGETATVSSTVELPALIEPLDDYDTGEKRLDLPSSATMKYVNLGIAVKNPVKGEVSCEYGYRIHPINNKESFHYGLDIAAPNGRNITPIAEGTVKNVGKSSAYGNYVTITHANGVESFYGHCSKILVKKGQKVKADTNIAKVGSTGYSTGNHLHLEITKDGINVNPLNYLDY